MAERLIATTAEVAAAQSAAEDYADAAVAAGISTSVTTSDGTLVKNTRVIANKGTLLTLAMPATGGAAAGDVIEVIGYGAGKWKITQPASVQIHTTLADTVAGVLGSVTAVTRYDCVRLVCTAVGHWVMQPLSGAPVLA